MKCYVEIGAHSEKDNRLSPLLSTGDARPGILCQVMGFPIQERHGHTGESPVNSC